MLTRPIPDAPSWHDLQKQVFDNPTFWETLDGDGFIELIEKAFFRLQRFRMGARSSYLFLLVYLLWHAPHRLKDFEKVKGKLDPEAYLALGFRIALDPSFINPEAGLLLVAVILARYKDLLREQIDSEKEWEELLRHMERVLLYLTEERGTVDPVVRETAWLLLLYFKGESKGLSSRMERVARILPQHIFNLWPEISDLRRILSEADVELTYRSLADILPGHNYHLTRAFYRLALERKGTWEIVSEFRLE